VTTARRKPAKATPAKATAAQPSSDAIVLTGPPGLLRATVSVENAVDQRVAVRGLTLHRSGQQALAGAGAAVIAPGATAQVPVSFRLEPDTPPSEALFATLTGDVPDEADTKVAA